MRKQLLLLFLSWGLTMALYAQPKREMRGVWISTVSNIDWPSAPGLSSATQQQQLISMLDNLKGAGINAVFLQVRPECDALYASTIDPWSYYLTGQQGQAPSPYYDPLAFAVTEAHKRGMELHAWLNPYRAKQGTPTLSSTHVASQHPDWVMRFSTRDILNPGLPQVRDYVVSVVNDITSRYDVDGIHFDDYFYPYSGMGNEDAATYSAYNPNGLSLADWRRDNVNKLMKMVYDKVQAVNAAQGKAIKFGVSPFGIWKSGVPSGITGMSAYDVIYADALAWLAQGTVDYLSPQLYWDFGGGQDYGKLSAWWDDQVAAKSRHHYPGLGLYRLIDEGTWPASTIQRMIDENRLSKNEATFGQLFFTANNLTGNDKNIRTTLQQAQYKYPALVPSLGWKEQQVANIPQNVRYQNGQLLWDVPAAASDGDLPERYAIYRFPTASGNATSDVTRLVAVTGDTFSGVPTSWLTAVDNYLGVTAIDKNNNETALSALVYVQGSPTYCTSKGNDPTYEWIAQVGVGSLSFSSGKDGGYANRTANVFPLTIGNNYSLKLVPGYSSTVYNENWKVWIDFNGDGDFTDAQEQVFSMASPAKNTITGTLTIPAGVQTGNRRMRVGMNGTSADYTLNSCSVFAYGEVEDYTVSLSAGSCTPPAITSILIDQEATSRYVETGSWTASTSQPGYEGSGYRQDGNTGKGQKSIRYTPTIQQAGNYTVYVKHTAFSNRATNVPVTVTHQNGSTTVTVNQQINDGWNSMGTYAFAAGTAGYVDISNTGTNGYVVADAVRFDFQSCPSAGARLSGVSLAGSSSVEEQPAGYLLYPNPSSDAVSLSLPAGLPAGRLSLTVYDFSGRKLQTASLPLSQGQQQLALPLQGLGQGIYLIRLQAPDGSLSTLQLLRQ